MKAMKIKKKDSGILFPFFREIVEYYFPNIGDYEVAALFRETWCLGSGKITIENFLTVLMERGTLSRL